MSPQTLPAPSDLPLTTSQLAGLRAMLEEQRAFRIDQLAQLHRPEPSGPLSSTDPEILGSLVSGARAALREVLSALWRMEEGSYGRCVDCSTAIPLERLEILPQTARCLSCQQPVER
jgi:DnaK suppressor protein